MMKLLLPFLIFGTVYSEKIKSEVEKIQEVTKNELPLPDFLCTNDQTPSAYIEDGMPLNGHIIKLGIQIDNYSRYTLKNPIFHSLNGYTAITNGTISEEVLPHRTEFTVLKSENHLVGGSISWEMFLGKKHIRKRFLVTFNIPYR